MAGSPVVGAWIAQLVFWALLFIGRQELGFKRIAIFFCLWVVGFVGRSFVPLDPGLFTPYVAILDIVLVFLIFRGDVQLTLISLRVSISISVARRSTKRSAPQIIAMGGGGFSAEPETLPLETYVVAQTRKAYPSVCFLPTATGESDTYVAKFFDAFTRLGCRPTVVRLFARTPDLRAILLNQDVIYVGGGNTKSMLAVWREWDVPRILRDAWKGGSILTGVSAGAICWFDVGITDSWAGRLAALPCLSLLSGGCCPHYDGEKERRPAVHELVARGDAPSTLALDDGAAAHFVGTRLHRVVSSRPGARGYQVQRHGHRSVETALPVVPV